jgi:hypothetical protein
MIIYLSTIDLFLDGIMDGFKPVYLRSDIFEVRHIRRQIYFRSYGYPYVWILWRADNCLHGYSYVRIFVYTDIRMYGYLDVRMCVLYG